MTWGVFEDNIVISEKSDVTGLYDGAEQEPRDRNELSGTFKCISMTESVNNIMQAHNALLPVLFCFYPLQSVCVYVCVRVDTLSGSF